MKSFIIAILIIASVCVAIYFVTDGNFSLNFGNSLSNTTWVSPDLESAGATGKFLTQARERSLSGTGGVLYFDGKNYSFGGTFSYLSQLGIASNGTYSISNNDVTFKSSDGKTFTGKYLGQTLEINGLIANFPLAITFIKLK